MNMNKLFRLLTLAALLLLAKPAEAQLINGPRGYEDFKIGVAGYTYRSYDIDQTLAFLKSMEVHYLSVKDWWLPLDSTKEQMDAFKAKCREYDVEPYILGPIYMRSEAEVDRAFAYAERYGADVFIGVPNYELTDYMIKKVKDTGIKVAIHTHGPDGAPFPNIQKVAEVYKDPSLGIGCCMDLGHSVRMGEDIVKDIKKYKAWIYDIHIKDESEASKKGQTWEMGRGVMDFRPIVKVLRQIKYKGVVSLEFEKNGKNPHPGVAESIGYLRGVSDGTK
ncbi:MAG: sugar phosphate isomerase/epimerase [Rikenellaceae bacterium]|nr:sugar phosphate isomerase/epimerase [Rikenellaceae bacterium]